MARVSPSEVVAMWGKYTSRIPAQFAVGLAERESGFDASEVDDYKSGTRVTPVQGGKYTVGLFQVSESEYREIDGDTGQWYVDALRDPETNTRVFATYMEKRLDTITALAGAREPDVWAYLALAHNAGIGMVRETIGKYGMDWEAFKARNAGTDQGKRWARYGDAAINGGTKWTDALADFVEEAASALTTDENGETDTTPIVLIAVAVGLLTYLVIA